MGLDSSHRISSSGHYPRNLALISLLIVKEERQEGRRVKRARKENEDMKQVYIMIRYVRCPPLLLDVAGAQPNQ